jgi:regulator of replication initiation timing
MIKDKKLKVLQNIKLDFNEAEHKYFKDGRELISVTTFLKSAGLGANYNAVDEDILKRARLRGEGIHYQVEDAVNNANFDELTDEGAQIVDYLAKEYNNGERGEFTDVMAEGMLYSNNPDRPYAGRFDILGKLGKEYILYDIKTMKSWSQTIENCAQWQLSLYAKALHDEFKIDVKELVILKFETIKIDDVEHFILKPKRVDKISDLEIDKLLMNGELPNNQIIPFDDKDIAIFKAIKQKEEEIKELEEQIKQVKDNVYEIMKERNILNAENEDGTLKITRVKDTTTETVDAKKLKVEEPLIYAKYRKIAERKGFVRIAFKD